MHVFCCVLRVVQHYSLPPLLPRHAITFLRSDATQSMSRVRRYRLMVCQVLHDGAGQTTGTDNAI